MAIRQQHRRLTTDDLKRVAESYNARATVYALAADFSCHRATIAERLKLAGIAMRHQPASIEKADEIVRLYESGLSLVKVADQVGVSARTVFNYLRKRDVPTRASHGRTR